MNILLMNITHEKRSVLLFNNLYLNIYQDNCRFLTKIQQDISIILYYLLNSLKFLQQKQVAYKR